MTDTATPATDTEPDWTKAGAPPEPERQAEQEHHDEATSVALAHYDDVVANLPQIPGKDEFLALCQMARVMSTSGIVPKSLQGKPADCLIVLLTGRDLGIPVTAATRKVYVIDGQPSIAPLLKLGLIRRDGLGKIVPDPQNRTNERLAVAHALDRFGNELGPPMEFSWDDAVAATLVRSDCEPSRHSDKCHEMRKKGDVKQSNGATANYCKDNWRKNPRRMLWWRAASFAADDYFPEVSMGIYTPDELGGMTDDDGNLIEANSVELPAGFGTGQGGTGGSRQGGAAEEDAPVSPEVSWSLQQRIYSLPADAQEEFRKRWKQAKVPGNVRHFPAAKAQLVEAFLRGVESQWKAQGGFDPDAALATTIGRLGEAVVATLQVWPAGTPAPKAAPTPTGAPEGDAATSPASGAGVAQAALLPAEAPTPAEPAQAATGSTTAPLAGDFDSDAWMDRVTSAEWDEATVDDVIDYATGEVKRLKLPEVNAALVAATASTDGAADDRRARLAALVCTALGVPVADQS